MRAKKVRLQLHWPDESDIITDSFRYWAIHISCLYKAYLPPLTIDIKKVIIELSILDDFVSQISNNDIPQTYAINNDGIYIIYCPFDFPKFNSHNNEAKAHQLLNSCFGALSFLFSEFKIDINHLKNTKDQILHNKFKFKLQLCNTPKLNHSKAIHAIVFAEYYLGYVIIKVELRSKKDDGLITSSDLYKTVPHSYIYLQLVKSCKWLDNHTFAVYNNSKEAEVRTCIEGNVSTHYYPTDRNIEEVQEEINFLTLKT